MMNKMLPISTRISAFFSQAQEAIDIKQIPTPVPMQALKPVDEIPSIGRRNAKIVDSLTQVRRVTIQLARSGFNIVDVIVSGRNPRIIINPCKRCELLGGALIKVTRLSCIEVRTMAANIDGVQVEWMMPNA